MRTSRENLEDNRRYAQKRTLTDHMRGKLAVTGLVIMLALFALLYRIYSIQKMNFDAYNQRILSQQRYDSREIPYRRGDIVDRNGTYLATSNKVYNLILDPKQINSAQENYLEPTVQLLSEVFGYDPSDLRRVITEQSESAYVRYAKQLTYDQKVEFETREDAVNKAYRSAASKERVYGVWFEDAYLRKYPYGSLACNVIGFSLSDGTEGSGGIEQYYNNELTGASGREYGYLNDDSNLERVIKPAEDGYTVVSTIDVKIQSIIEKYIDEFEDEMGSRNVTAVIVMNPNNGEILGMATSRYFDLNDPRNLDPWYTPEEQEAMDDAERTEAWSKIWRNFCISDTYEPGSVSKIFTVAAGLEDGVIDGHETYECRGSLDVGGWTIHCAKRIGHGPLTVTESLMQSCNVAMMYISRATGVSEFCRFQRLFGFGAKTGIDLPGEADTSGLIHTPDDMRASDLATNSFGQNFNCSMVQMAAGFASVINGGSYYQPHVVRQVLNAQGSVVRDIEPELVRETVSADTSAFIRQALLRTVSEGTGKAAGVEGYDIGGKTGTAEKYPRELKNYLVSFCGFAPAENPQVLCYVIVDTPDTDDQAHSTFASGIFKNIMSEVLPYMNIFPNGEYADALIPEGAELPENEGITDNTASEPEEPREPIVYDTEESVSTDGLEGDAFNIPGAPPGMEGEEYVPEEDPENASGDTSGSGEPPDGGSGEGGEEIPKLE